MLNLKLSINILLIALFLCCADVLATEAEVKVFKTSISDAAPELNFVIKNNSNKNLRVGFFTDQNYTNYECGLEFGETPIGDGASMIKSSSLLNGNNILELDRYIVDIQANSTMISYMTFNYENGVTRLPCDIEYYLVGMDEKIIYKNIYRVERPTKVDSGIGAKLRDFKILKSVQVVKERGNMTAVILMSNLSSESANIKVEEKKLIDCDASLADEKIRLGMQRGGKIDAKGYLPIYTSLTFNDLKKNKKCKVKLKLINEDDLDDKLEVIIPMVQNAVYKDYRNRD